MTFKKRKMFNVWFPSYGFVFQLIHNIPKFSLDLCCVTLLRICRQIAQIEYFTYGNFRVLFLACDGRRQADPNAVSAWPSCLHIGRLREPGLLLGYCWSLKIIFSLCYFYWVILISWWKFRLCIQTIFVRQRRIQDRCTCTGGHPLTPPPPPPQKKLSVIF